MCIRDRRRSEAARCGLIPGVILATRELSSGSGGVVGWKTVDPGLARLSPRPACLEDSFVSLPEAGGIGDLVPISSSRMPPSWGTGLRLNSGGGRAGGGGIGAVVCGVRTVLLLGGMGMR